MFPAVMLASAWAFAQPHEAPSGAASPAVPTSMGLLESRPRRALEAAALFDRAARRALDSASVDERAALAPLLAPAPAPVLRLPAPSRSPAPPPLTRPPLPTFGGRRPGATWTEFKFELWRHLSLRSFYGVPRSLIEKLAFHRELWNLEYRFQLRHPQRPRRGRRPR